MYMTDSHTWMTWETCWEKMLKSCMSFGMPPPSSLRAYIASLYTTHDTLQFPHPPHLHILQCPHRHFTFIHIKFSWVHLCTNVRCHSSEYSTWHRTNNNIVQHTYSEHAYGSLSLYNQQWVQWNGNKHRLGKDICVTYTSLQWELAKESHKSVFKSSCSVCFVFWMIFLLKKDNCFHWPFVTCSHVSTEIGHCCLNKTKQCG